MVGIWDGKNCFMQLVRREFSAKHVPRWQRWMALSQSPIMTDSEKHTSALYFTVNQKCNSRRWSGDSKKSCLYRHLAQGIISASWQGNDVYSVCKCYHMYLGCSAVGRSGSLPLVDRRPPPRAPQARWGWGPAIYLESMTLSCNMMFISESSHISI